MRKYLFSLVAVIAIISAAAWAVSTDGRRFENGRKLERYVRAYFGRAASCVEMRTNNGVTFWLLPSAKCPDFRVHRTGKRILIKVVQPGTYLGDIGVPVRIGPYPHGSPGATILENGAPTVLLLDPDIDAGELPAELMSHNKEKIDLGVLMAHETFGHAECMADGVLGLLERNTNACALDAENLFRLRRDPNSQIRLAHDPPVGAAEIARLDEMRRAYQRVIRPMQKDATGSPD